MKTLVLLISLIFSLNLLSQDPIYYCPVVEDSEAGGKLLSLRVNDMDSTMSIQFRLNWENKVEPINYFYHPNVELYILTTANVNDSSIFVSYVAPNAGPFKIPDNERLIQLEFDNDIGNNITVDNIEFTKGDFDPTVSPPIYYANEVEAIETCPLIPPFSEAELIVSTEEWVKENTVMIWPNPTIREFGFNYVLPKPTVIQVYDSVGKLVHTEMNEQGNIVLPHKGVFYFVSLYGSETIIVN